MTQPPCWPPPSLTLTFDIIWRGRGDLTAECWLDNSNRETWSSVDQSVGRVLPHRVYWSVLVTLCVCLFFLLSFFFLLHSFSFVFSFWCNQLPAGRSCDSMFSARSFACLFVQVQKNSGENIFEMFMNEQWPCYHGDDLEADREGLLLTVHIKTVCLLLCRHLSLLHTSPRTGHKEQKSLPKTEPSASPWWLRLPSAELQPDKGEQ